MPSWALTIILSFILILLALLGLGISWLLTGKSRLKHCGSQTPGGKKNDCVVCQNKTCKKEKDKTDEHTD